MIIIQLDNNNVTIRRGEDTRPSADAEKENTKENIAPAKASNALGAEDTAKKSGGDARPTGQGGNVGPTGPGGNVGPTGPGGGGPGSMVVVGPIIMRGSGNGQPRPVLSGRVKKEGGLGISHEATKAVTANLAVAPEEQGKTEKGGAENVGPTGPGGGGAGSMIVVGPIVIQDFAEEGATRSDPQGDSLGRAKAAQAAAGTGHKS